MRAGSRRRFFTIVDLVNQLQAYGRAGHQGRIADYLTRLDFVVPTKGFDPCPEYAKRYRDFPMFRPAIRNKTVATMHLTLKKETTHPPGTNSLQRQARFNDFVIEFNEERPHEALAMKRPAELYEPSTRAYDGLPELSYPLHDREVLVTACGRSRIHRKRINVSTVLTGQRLGIKEVDEGIWIVSLMRYNLGFIDLEQRTLQPLDNPFGPRLSPMS